MKKINFLTSDFIETKRFLTNNDIPFYYNKIECFRLFSDYEFTIFLRTKEKEELIKNKNFDIIM